MSRLQQCKVDAPVVEARLGTTELNSQVEASASWAIGASVAEGWPISCVISLEVGV